MTWTPRQRFDAVLAGEPADRPLVSAWRHHRDSEHPGGTLAQWTIDFVRQWDLDWVKLNPRATYYAEIWGNRYRYGDYETRDIPRQSGVAVNSLDDMARVEPRPTSQVLAEQVEFTRDVHEGLPELPVLQTLFSPLSTLIQMSGLSYYPGKPVFGQASGLTLEQLLGADPALTHAALQAITDTYVNYLHQLTAAGADGIFYAITATAHPEITTPETFAEFSERYDRQLLDATDLHIVTHTCGEHSGAERFADWPGAISWDQFADGNPGLDSLPGAVEVGGVDHRRFQERDTIAAQARAAANLARRRPLLITPTCSILSAHATDESLAVFVREGRGE